MTVSALAAAQAPATPAAASAFSSLTRNIDTFLTLLTTQLRNQDPLDPLDTEKFTSQLVQFASVEQSIRTNSHLEALIAIQGASDRAAALAFVGRTAEFATDRAPLGPTGAVWTYQLPGAASAVALRVLNANGVEVARSAGPNAAGANSWRWDGRTAAGEAAPEGVYRLAVDALGADGRPLKAEISASAAIEGASFGPNGATLITAAGPFRLDDLRRVSAESR